MDGSAAKDPKKAVYFDTEGGRPSMVDKVEDQPDLKKKTHKEGGLMERLNEGVLAPYPGDGSPSVMGVNECRGALIESPKKVTSKVASRLLRQSRKEPKLLRQTR